MKAGFVVAWTDRHSEVALRKVLEAMAGVTVFPRLGTGRMPDPVLHVPLVAYAGVSAADDMHAVLSKLRDHHQHFAFDPDWD